MVTRYPSSARRTDVTVVPHDTGAAISLAYAAMKSTTSDMRHEPVGVVAVVRVAGEPALPIGRQQAQRIPSLASPRVGDLVSFEDDVVDRTLREAAAHGEPAVPGPDDDRCGVAPNRPPVRAVALGQATSTLTLVGLVMMSYTAERFCDCATSALMSSGDASASIL